MWFRIQLKTVLIMIMIGGDEWLCSNAGFSPTLALYLISLIKYVPYSLVFTHTDNEVPLPFWVIYSPSFCRLHRQIQCAIWPPSVQELQFSISGSHSITVRHMLASSSLLRFMDLSAVPFVSLLMRCVAKTGSFETLGVRFGNFPNNTWR